MSRTRLVVCGSIAVDRIMNFSGYYRDLIEQTKIEVLSVSVLVDSLEEAEGGTGGNIAHNMASLGDKPLLMGSVGKNAARYLERLKSEGVDTSGVHLSDQSTASFNVLTDSASNQVGGFYPGAMSDAATLSFERWNGQDIVACVSAHDPTAMLRQTQECAQHSIRLVYDPGQQVSNISGSDLRTGVNAAEVVIVNEYELHLLCKKTGWTEAKLAAKVPLLISTLGELGSYITGNSITKPIKIGRARPTQIADPTGAGDAYRAGFLYGYLRQWEPAKCGQLGAVVASFALENHGPQTKLSKQTLQQRYQQTFNERITL